MGIYVTEEVKANLKQYHYVGADNSLLSKLQQPYWEFCAKLLPSWMAPNLVTLLGFFGVIAAYLLVCCFYAPTFQNENIPSYIYYIASALIFFYQTMDAIDGKQARRTKNSSALGGIPHHSFEFFLFFTNSWSYHPNFLKKLEMFDHGCDAISSFIFSFLTHFTSFFFF